MKMVRNIRFLFLFVVLVSSLQVFAQDKHRKFDPKRFEADLEQFIVKEAGLSPKEAAGFFPIYREKQKKQRALFVMMERYRHVDTRDNKACLEAIRAKDETDIQMKKLQHEYHEKFFDVLPAGKVLKIIKAEEKFHRVMFCKAAKRTRKSQK